MSNPFSLIQHDHRNVEALFKEFESIGDKSIETKKGIIEDIKHELEVHARMEENILYPKLREIFGSGDGDLVKHALKEHESIKDLLDEIDNASANSDDMDSKIKDLKKMVEHHVEEEESNILPKAEGKLTEEEQAELAESLIAFKNEEA